MEGALVPWRDQALVAGQRARAVRKDVPMGLLIAVVFGMDQAMAITRAVRVFVSMLRKALAPEGKPA